VELVEHNIEVFKSNTKENESINIFQGNSLDSELPRKAELLLLLMLFLMDVLLTRASIETI